MGVNSSKHRLENQSRSENAGYTISKIFIRTSFKLTNPKLLAFDSNNNIIVANNRLYLKELISLKPSLEILDLKSGRSSKLSLKSIASRKVISLTYSQTTSILLLISKKVSDYYISFLSSNLALLREIVVTQVYQGDVHNVLVSGSSFLVVCKKVFIFFEIASDHMIETCTQLNHEGADSNNLIMIKSLDSHGYIHAKDYYVTIYNTRGYQETTMCVNMDSAMWIDIVERGNKAGYYLLYGKDCYSEELEGWIPSIRIILITKHNGQWIFLNSYKLDIDKEYLSIRYSMRRGAPPNVLYLTNRDQLIIMLFNEGYHRSVNKTIILENSGKVHRFDIMKEFINYTRETLIADKQDVYGIENSGICKIEID